MLYRAICAVLLFRVSPEAAHRLAVGVLRIAMAVPGVRALARRRLVPRDAALRVRALGLDLPSPVGLAAGFDKDACAFEELGALGFGFVEVGTITAEPQPGNPRPRLFRLPLDRALVNRMGFNNPGARAAAERLARPRTTIVGANIGKTKSAPEGDAAIADYVASAESLGPHADYVVVNVSSPNTPGLRDLQSIERLGPLLSAVRAALDRSTPRRRVPLLVKIAPDLADEDVDAIARLALELGIDGIVATNTTVARGGLRSARELVEAAGAGGLSGPPLASRALEVLARLHALAGDRLVLIASGGIETADDAWERVRAGATLVQLYTGFVYRGPLVARRIALGLAARARAAGFARVEDAVGSSVRATGAS